MYQDNCEFDKGHIIKEGEIQNLEDCVSHCFNVTRCSHFSYNRNSKSCSLKEITQAQLKADRSDLGVGSGTICGYIPSRWKINSLETNTKIPDVISSGLPHWALALISLAVVTIVVLIIVSIVAFYKYKVI